MKSSTQTFYASLVACAVQDIRAGIDGALDLHALARRAALAPLHFHRIFRGLVGETPLELHRRLRLERAASQLATTEVPVTRIALAAGYETHESFTRAFNAAFGAPPSEFRKSAQVPATPWTAFTKTRLAATSRIHADSDLNLKPNLLKEGSAMQVELLDCASKYVLAVRHVGPYTAVSEAFARLDTIARTAGLLELQGLELVALYHDDPDVTPASELRADAGLVVPHGVPPTHGLQALTIPAGTYARTVHVGPYQDLPDSWSELMGPWLADSNYRIGTGPSYERYINTPGDVPPAELRTELYLPVVLPRSECR
jgi:AraC family transcriptional regulator